MGQLVSCNPQMEKSSRAFQRPFNNHGYGNNITSDVLISSDIRFEKNVHMIYDTYIYIYIYYIYSEIKHFYGFEMLIIVTHI